MSEHEPIVDQAALAAQARAQSLIGRVIAGRYKIHDVIAMGGMAAVFLGEHVHMRKRVALKLLHPDAENLPEMVGRFENESIVGAHVEHPNIASASDFGQLEDGSYYLVLEYVRGITLHELIRRGPVPTERAVDIARQLATALDALHERGILHRDLKPRNIMIGEGARGVVKLIDFGLAKVPLDRISTVSGDAQRAKQPITGTGIIFGTVAYMAPEAALGMEAVTARSDLYALGIVLYEMLAGAHPFDAKEQGALFMQQRTMTPPPIASKSPGVVVSPELEAVVMRLLEKSPTARYQSAIDVFMALGAAVPRVLSGAPPANPTKPIAAAVVPRDRALSHAASPAAPKPKRSPRSRATKSKPKAVRAQGPVLAKRLIVPVGAAAAILGVLATVVATRDSEPETSDVSGSSSASPSALPSASVAPAALSSAPLGDVTPPARPTLVDGQNAATWRTRLRLASPNKDWDKGTAAVLALTELEPASFRQPDMASAAADVATGTALSGGERATRVYDALSSTSEGIDILYELAFHRAASKGAKRAREQLGKKEVVQRGSPALRIIMALREPGCDKKAALFDRAAADGDARTLGFLWSMHSAQCNPKNGECCFKDDKGIEEAIRTLKSRIQPAKP